MPSCYLTDLDGTLLRSDQSLSDYTKRLADRVIGTNNDDAVARYIAAERSSLTT